MLPEEIVRKVRLIEITTRKAVDDLMSGAYKSQFKGSGVQFSEHRQYVAGDDVRHIDWKVSARARDPMIKKFEEERQLNFLLVVDVSGSESFGSERKLKSEVVAEVAGMLAYAAIHSGDKVGAILFAGEVEHVLPPKQGRAHIQRIIRDLLVHEPRTQGTDLASALRSANRIMKHSGIVFVVSDFMAQGYQTPLTQLSIKNDVVAIRVRDQRESEVPAIGEIPVVDPETGQERWVDTSSYAFKTWLKQTEEAQAAEFAQALRAARVESVQVSTREDYGEAIVRFFRTRARRRA